MKRELLFSITRKDLDVQTFNTGGPGGQNQNKREMGVRIVHKASGAVGESREERSQYQNKKIALKRLVEHPKFKVWHNRKVMEIIDGKTLEQKVDEMMNPKFIKVEVKKDNMWTELEKKNESKV
jgi:protein subunit release factor B